MPIRTVLLEKVRRLAIKRQGLSGVPSRPTKRALLQLIKSIGLLQIDAIHVVARSQFLVLWSRLGTYPTHWLDELLYPDRSIFEYWAHAACLIPMEDLPPFSAVIRDRGSRPHRKLHRLGDNPEQVLSAVRDRVLESGVATSRDFEDPRAKRGTWWDWKPAKVALEILFDQGLLAVSRRVGFHRQYTTAKQVYGDTLSSSRLTLEDWSRWATLRALKILGVGTVRHIADYYRQTQTEVATVLAAGEKTGEIVRVAVPDWKEPAYSLAADLPRLRENKGKAPSRTTFLSPFDNLIWDRRRTNDLFNFDYRFEAYTPLATKQRRFGYYSMPILHCDRLVGRLDPKADKAAGILRIRALHLEPETQVTTALVDGLSAALRDFAQFHGCSRVLIGRRCPASVRTEILRRL